MDHKKITGKAYKYAMLILVTVLMNIGLHSSLYSAETRSYPYHPSQTTHSLWQYIKNITTIGLPVYLSYSYWIHKRTGGTRNLPEAIRTGNEKGMAYWFAKANPSNINREHNINRSYNWVSSIFSIVYDIKGGHFFYPYYNSALGIAIERKKTNLVEPLLKKGANPNLLSNGYSLQRAIDSDPTTLPLLLQKGGLDPHKKYYLLALDYKEDEQGRLVSATNPQEHPGYCMNAPLVFVSARNGKKKDVFALVKAGVIAQLCDNESKPVTFKARINGSDTRIGWDEKSLELFRSASKTVKRTNATPLAGVVPTDPQGKLVAVDSSTAKAFTVAGIRNLVADFLTPGDALNLAIAGREAKAICKK